MKSIKKKLIAAILVCSLFTAVLIGVLAISNSMNTAGKDAVTKLQLTEQKKAQEINSVIQKIQQSVDTLSEVAMSSFDYDAFVKDKAYADTYTKSVQKSVLDFANHTNGAVTAYLRYNPKYSNPTSNKNFKRVRISLKISPAICLCFSSSCDSVIHTHSYRSVSSIEANSEIFFPAMAECSSMSQAKVSPSMTRRRRDTLTSG